MIPVLLAITLHEAAHGYVAHAFGDDTAWQLGRVSLPFGAGAETPDVPPIEIYSRIVTALCRSARHRIADEGGQPDGTEPDA